MSLSDGKKKPVAMVMASNCIVVLFWSKQYKSQVIVLFKTLFRRFCGDVSEHFLLVNSWH